MLDFAVSPVVPDLVWDALPQTPAFSGDLGTFSPPRNGGAGEPRRRHHRAAFRGRALLRQGVMDRTFMGVYTLDISPASIGFLCPIQLFPLQRVAMQCEQCDELPLIVRRCRRLDDGCFHCGANFADGPKSPAAFMEFLRSMR